MRIIIGYWDWRLGLDSGIGDWDVGRDWGLDGGLRLDYDKLQIGSKLSRKISLLPINGR